MINFKQEELIESLLKKIKGKYPEVELVNITESPEDPESLWINVSLPENEDRKAEVIDYATDITSDILVDYGYHMLLMPAGKKAA